MAANNGWDAKAKSYTPVGAKTDTGNDNGWDAQNKSYTTVGAKVAKAQAYNQAFDRLSQKPYEGDTQDANKTQNTLELVKALQQFPAASTPFENAAQPFNPTLPNLIPGYGSQPMDKQDTPEQYSGTSSYGSQPMDKEDVNGAPPDQTTPFYPNTSLEPAPPKSLWQKTKDTFGSIFGNQGDIHNTIRAGADAFGQGVIDGVPGGNALLTGAFKNNDPGATQPWEKNPMGAAQADLQKQDSQYISPTAEWWLNTAGQVAPMVTGIGGAYEVGGKFLGNVAGHLLENAPQWLSKAGTGIAAGVGTGAALEGVTQGIDATTGFDNKTPLQRLERVGQSAALFGALGGAFPGAGSLLDKVGDSLPHAVQDILSTAAKKAPLSAKITRGAAEGTIAGGTVGTAMGAIDYMNGKKDANGKPETLGQDVWNNVKDQVKTLVAFGLVHHIATGALAKTSALQDSIISPGQSSGRTEAPRNVVDAQYSSAQTDQLPFGGHLPDPSKVVPGSPEHKQQMVDNIQQEVFNRLPDEDKADLQSWIDNKVKNEGVSEADAKAQALDMISTVPEGKTLVGNVVNDIVESETNKLIAGHDPTSLVNEITGSNAGHDLVEAPEKSATTANGEQNASDIEASHAADQDARAMQERRLKFMADESFTPTHLLNGVPVEVHPTLNSLGMALYKTDRDSTGAAKAGYVMPETLSPYNAPTDSTVKQAPQETPATAPANTGPIDFSKGAKVTLRGRTPNPFTITAVKGDKLDLESEHGGTLTVDKRVISGNHPSHVPATPVEPTNTTPKATPNTTSQASTGTAPTAPAETPNTTPKATPKTATSTSSMSHVNPDTGVTQHVKIDANGQVTVTAKSNKLDHESLPRNFDAESLKSLSHTFHVDDYLNHGSGGNPHYNKSQFLKKQIDYNAVNEKHDYHPLIDRILDDQRYVIDKAIEKHQGVPQFAKTFTPTHTVNGRQIEALDMGTHIKWRSKDGRTGSDPTAHFKGVPIEKPAEEVKAEETVTPTKENTATSLEEIKAEEPNKVERAQPKNNFIAFDDVKVGDRINVYPWGNQTVTKVSDAIINGMGDRNNPQNFSRGDRDKIILLKPFTLEGDKSAKELTNSEVTQQVVDWLIDNVEGLKEKLASLDKVDAIGMMKRATNGMGAEGDGVSFTVYHLSGPDDITKLNIHKDGGSTLGFDISNFRDLLAKYYHKQEGVTDVAPPDKDPNAINFEDRVRVQYANGDVIEGKYLSKQGNKIYVFSDEGKNIWFAADGDTTITKIPKEGNDNAGALRPDGQGSHEGKPSEDVSGTSTGGGTGRNGSKNGEIDGRGNGSDKSPTRGERPDSGGGEHAPEVDTSELDTRPSVGVEQGQDTSANGGGRTESSPSTATVHGQTQSKLAGRDFVITDELDNLGNAKTKFKGNILAIRTLVDIVESQRALATPDEQAILAKYVGWGGLSQAFNADHKDWKQEYAELRSLVDEGIISEPEYAEARKSTQYAHYTSKEIIGAMYDALARFGFKGGRILEPGVGTGNFFGLMPKDMTALSSRTGVDQDRLTGRIAKLLYPKANIQIKPFQDYKIDDGYFDLAIGNPPFSPNRITYGTGKNKRELLTHNYFFVQAMDKVRDGGIVAFITSAGSMNTPASAASRKMMTDRADFLGAIRLPGDAFKKNAGTEVTADIIFFQKRPEGQEPQHVSDFNSTEKINITEKGVTHAVDVNSYFVKHPDLVLGENAIDKLERFKDDKGNIKVRLGVKSDGRNLEEALKEAVSKLPTDIYQSRAVEAGQEPVFEDHYSSDNTHDLDEGGYAVQDGRLIQRKGDRMVEDTALTDAKRERIRAMIPLRNVARGIVRMQRAGAGDAELKTAQDELNTLYDKFVKKYGYLNDASNVGAMKADPVGMGLLMSLENEVKTTEKKDKKGKNIKATYSKGDLFDKRTIQPARNIEHAENASDAMFISLYEHGYLNLEHMSKVSGIPIPKLLEDLQGKIYHNPDTNIWETEDAYLSGNVRQKLAVAQEAALTAPRQYEANVKALEAVQPIDKEPHEITVRLNSPWIEPHIMETFIQEFLDAKPGQVKVHANPLIAGSSIEEIHKGFHPSDTLARSVKNLDEYGVRNPNGPSKTALDLIEDGMNSRIPTVSVKDGDKLVPSEALSLDAKNKQKAILETFSRWLWEDEARAAELGRTYNDRFNNTVFRDFNGELIYGKHKTNSLLPGSTIDLMPHQRNVVWRMVQGYNTLVAHVVGSGKTYSLIHGSMEMKRLGIINKPAFVVPNHLLKQWERDFRKAYPGVRIYKVSSADIPPSSTQRRAQNILDKNGKPQYHPTEKTKTGNPKLITRPMSDAEYNEKNNLRRTERAAALSKIAVGQYDAIIITHKTFEKLPMSPQAVEDHIRQQIDDVIEALHGARTDGGDPKTIKQLEKIKEGLEKKLRANLDEASKDVVIPFEELGIDQLFVDESHMFKNLQFHTKMRNVSSLPQTNSNRAQDMYLKSQYLNQLRSGRGLVFATGTPITNAVAEMYTIQRFLAMDALREHGISHFDAWAGTFGSIINDTEVTATGEYKDKTRFAEYNNIPALQQMFRTFADVQTADMLDLPTPAHKIQERIIVPISPDQQEYLGEIRDRALNMKNMDPRDDNYLKLTGDARKMALDIRLVRPDITKDFEDSKINAAIAKMVDIYFDPEIAKDKHGNRVDKHTQLVFLDLGTPKKTDVKEDNEDKDENTVDEASEEAQNVSVYEDIRRKLVDKGVPLHEIAFIHDANTDKRKEVLFEKVREGEVRFLIGSTEKMGAGMNAQDRIVALHHLDAPWRPSDLEQREGRIFRQGNKNDSVYLYVYGTKGTFDEQMWDTIRRKAKMIAQVISGKFVGNSVEEVEAVALEFAQIASEMSGNPLLKEKNDADKKLNELQIAKSNYESSKRDYKREITRIPDEIKMYGQRIKTLEADKKRAQSVPEADQIIVADGVTFRAPTEAEIAAWDKAFADAKAKAKKDGKALKPNELNDLREEIEGPSYKEAAGQKIIDLYNASYEKLSHAQSATLGTFGGFDLVYSKGIMSSFSLNGAISHFVNINPESAIGTYSRLANGFEKIKENEEADGLRNEITIKEKRLKELEALANKTFTQEQALRDAMERSNELHSQILGLNNAHAQAATEDNSDDEGDYGLAMTPVGSPSSPKASRQPHKPKTPPANPVQRMIEETDKVLTPKVSTAIADMIAKHLETVVYEGSKRGSQGYYDPKISKTATVQEKSMGEWRVVGHELGHAFSDYYGGGDRLSSDKLSSTFPKAELRELGRQLYPDAEKFKRLPVKAQVEEGFAEFFRQWVADPATAEKNAPLTFAMFHDFIEKNPQLKEMMAKIRMMVDADFNANVFERASDSIISSDGVSELDSLPGAQYEVRNIFRPIFKYLDSTLPAKDMDKMLKSYGKEQEVELAKLLALTGNPQAKAKMLFTAKARDQEGNIIEGRVLDKIVQEAIDEIGRVTNWKDTVSLNTVDQQHPLYKEYRNMNAQKIWNVIYTAARFKDRYDRGFKKAPMTREMVDEVLHLAETNFPKVFNQSEVYGKRGLLEELAHTASNIHFELLERAGMSTPETRRTIEAGSDMYMPIITDRKKAKMITGKAGQGRAVKNTLRYYKESSLPILDPLQAWMIKYVEMYKAIERKRVFDKVQEMISTPGIMGAFGHFVENPTRKIVVSEDMILEKVGHLLNDDADMTDVFKDHSLSFFVPAGLDKIASHKPIIMNLYSKNKGETPKPYFIELAPDVFKMLQSMDAVMVEGFGKWLVHTAKVGRYVGLGTPRYIVSGAIRDLETMIIQSKAPWHSLVTSQIDALNAIIGQSERGKEIYASFVNSGAYNSAAENMIVSQLTHKFDTSFIRTHAEGWYHVNLADGRRILVRALNGMHEILKFNEEMPRLVEFIGMMKKQLGSKEMFDLFLQKGTAGLPPELRKHMEGWLVNAGYAASEVTGNFSGHGTEEWFRKYTPTVPFLHGTGTGSYRTARMFKDQPVRATLRTLMLTGLLGLLSWWSMNRDDKHKKVLRDMASTARDGYFWFPSGIDNVYLPIAKGYDYAIPINMVERYLDYRLDHEKGSRKLLDSLDSLFGGFLHVQGINNLIQTVINMYANVNGNGGAIVPQSELTQFKQLRKGALTSYSATEASKLYGDIVGDPTKGPSPRMIDYFLKQTLGMYGTLLLNVTDTALRVGHTGKVGESLSKSFQTTTGIEYAPVIGQLLVGQAEGTSRIVNNFYNDYNKMQTLSGSTATYMKSKTVPAIPAALLTQESILKLSYLPAMKYLSTEMTATRKTLQQKIADAPNADVRRKFVTQLDYAEKLTAGLLYGVMPADPLPDSGLTPKNVSAMKAYLSAGAQQAIVNEANSPGGVSDQIAYLKEYYDKVVKKRLNVVK